MDKVGCDVLCKSHSARSDRDQYRICPTKLTKSELEDVYFALLENNLELKKTINGQQDRIKVLSTKMQRMTSAQKVFQGVGKKDCCVANKTFINQQKEIISELKRSNERMADRIRKLNMRLCSAKQFCKSATPRCLRCSSSTSPYLIKNSPCSYKQQSQSTIKLAVSCQNLSRDTFVSRYVQTEAFEMLMDKTPKACDDNKCKSLIEDLKQKIENLQEELTLKQSEYSSRIEVLERDIQQARELGTRAACERGAAEHELQQTHLKCTQLLTSLRAAEGLNTELKTQLSIEKRKVVELETRLKTATMSDRVSKTIEDTLTSIQESIKVPPVDITYNCCCSPRHQAELNTQHMCSTSSQTLELPDESLLSKSAGDSGYIDSSQNQDILDDKSLNKIIEDLTQRIVVLQAQVDYLVISPPDAPEAIIDDHTSEDNTNIPIKLIEHQPKTYDNVPKVEIAQPQDNKEPTKIMTKETSHSKNDKQDTLQVPSRIPVPKPPGPKTNVDKITSETKNITQPDEKVRENNENAKEDTKPNIIERKQSVDKPKETEKAKETAIKRKESIDKNKINTEQVLDTGTNNKNIEISKDTVNNSEKQELKEASTGSDDKTYVVEKPKNVTIEKEITVPEKDKNVLTNIKDIIAKQKSVDKTDKKIIEKNNNVPIDKDLGNKCDAEKPIGLKDINSAKKLSVEKIRRVLKTQKTIRQKPEKESKFKKLVTRAVIEAGSVSTCEEATYTVDGDRSRDTSPDNTDFEISSMTDLPEEKEPKSPPRARLSPGERKYQSTPTDTSRSERVTTPTYYSLSEGEVPVTTVRRKSYGDKPRTEFSFKASEPKMDETLQTITAELARCEHLLLSQRSHEHTMPTLL
ncbi:uncharacterized protein LOC142987130 [Anticarsia gemmatalis]|uniref:uncharacterized protein LOC142987130 n=1 Tax=Anticarsia gemmatalis TaxID=129554 RepID=UPI003F76C543